MKTIFNSSEKINELIFENKNKVYGAYMLRKSYKDNLIIALVSTTTLFGIIAYFAFNFNKQQLDMLADFSSPDIDSVIVHKIDITPLVQIEPKIEEKKPIEDVKPPKSDELNIKVTDEKTPTELIPNERLKIIPGGTIDGDSTIKDRKDFPSTSLIEGPEIPTTPILYATEMPEFENMQKYISDNLRYPQIAKENGTSGTVGISFIVEIDGTLSDIKIVKGIGDGCEQEALRVVSTMKKWKPGKHNGQHKRVLLTLPIKFRLN